MPVSIAGESTDEELDWEEVHVPEEPHLELQLSPPVPLQNIEITLQTRPKADDTKKKAAAAVHAQRVLRTTSHKIHTVALLANARIRNKWINDPLLHARLMSVTPLALQNGFAMIHKSRVPDQNKRGRLFEAAVDRLVTWWCETFSVSSTGHVKSRTFEEVEAELARSGGPESDHNGYERIRAVESLMKHLLMQRGSRDTSAQLFTALCRALDIPARLIVSLQSVPWKSASGKSVPRKYNPKGKGKASQRPPNGAHVESDDQSETEVADTLPSKYKGKSKEVANPVIKLRQRKSQSTSRSESPAIGARITESQNLMNTPPVFWTEVFSRADSRWLPVDPIRGIVNNRHAFDPGASKTGARQDNRMLYVIGLEEDGFGRDITARYAREYTAKVSKIQAVGGGPTGGRKEWWSRVVQSITRPYRLQRDDLEDDELHNHQLTEGMPTTIAGFKNHPLYALARHLRRDQVIDPPTELGKFRGEPVYPRSCVISLKTAENWMRQGRIVRQGCQPMKMVKQRVMTVNRQREIELALDRANAEGPAGGDEDVMQGLYAFSQTELYIPDPIKDGKIPKNDFGNIDLYVPSMLPDGAAHIPYKGAAKLARKLGFDYAEAVTGFEFRKRRAVPVIQGIVTAAENEIVIVEACLEAEQEAEQRARAKRLERACKRWIRLVHGLRIRERLQQQYASGRADEHTPQRQEQEVSQQRGSWLDANEDEKQGGYLTTADDVVEPFHLPRDLHRSDPLVATTSRVYLSDDRGHPELAEDNLAASVSFLDPSKDDDDDDDDDAEGEMEVEAEAEADPEPVPPKGAPKTMRELAESHARREMEENGTPTPQRDEDDLTMKEEDSRVPEARVVAEDGDEGPGRRTARKRRAPGTKVGTQTKPSGARTTRTSKKRMRRQQREEDEGGGSSDVDGGEAEEAEEEAEEEEEEEGSPCKRRRGRRRRDDESSTRGATGSPWTLASTTPTNPDPGSVRVLRPRPQKTAARLREERVMEEAYRRAVAE